MKTAPSLFTAAALLSLLLHVAPAQAQLVRSFVSAAGNDANSCARTAPCRTFAVAITKTDAGGEIHTLDPAGYGPVTIDKSISIVSGLGEAGVLVAAGQTGITISAGSTDVINLRGLILEGGGVGQNGIVVNSGASLNVQNGVIRGFTHIGLNFTPGAASMLSVSNTLVSDFTNASGIGINVVPAAGAVTAVLNRADVLRIGGTGVYAGANTTVVLRNSTIVGNTVGVDITNGTAVSFGNNAITGNGTNVLGGTIPEQGARGPAGPQDRRDRQARPTPHQPQSAAAGGCTRLAS